MKQKIFYPDFFNDVFGPIMQPGSSSSFAGVSRVGRVARYTLKSKPAKVRILFNADSPMYLNLGNMMEDRGLLGGLQDFAPDDIRLFTAHEEARKNNLAYEFTARKEPCQYGASISFELIGSSGDTATFTGESIGGGMIRSYEIHGFPIQWQADTYAVLIFGDASAITQQKQNLVEEQLGTKIVAQDEYIRSDGKKALFFELEEEPNIIQFEQIFSDVEIRILPALLPVVTRHDKKPQLFKSVEEWRKVAQERGISFVEAAIEYEKNASLWTKEQILDYFEKIASVLDRQIHSLEITGINEAKDTPLLPVYGKQWYAYRKRTKIIEDPLTDRILQYAFATNAKLPGFEIVPGPMGTGGGYLFSALRAVQEKRAIPHEKLIESLIVAAGLGAIAYTLTRCSGVIGCVGESGVCCAMGSGAVTWLCGGTGEQVEHAASMALQANIGIPCDPIPGGLEFPCLTRTLRAAITAPLYADLALSGIDPLVPYHEALLAADRHYKKAAPETLTGACCGMRCTPTSQRCLEFLHSQMRDKMAYAQAE